MTIFWRYWDSLKTLKLWVASLRHLTESIYCAYPNLHFIIFHFILQVQPHLKKCFDNIKSLKMAKVKKKTNWDVVFCYYLRSRPIDWKNHGEPLCDPLDFVCVIASTDGYHTEDWGSWNVLCRRWICGVWTFCSAGRTSWGVNRTYTCSNSDNFTHYGTFFAIHKGVTFQGNLAEDGAEHFRSST